MNSGESGRSTIGRVVRWSFGRDRRPGGDPGSGAGNGARCLLLVHDAWTDRGRRGVRGPVGWTTGAGGGPTKKERPRELGDDH